MNRHRVILVLGLLLAIAPAVMAQSSASYRMEETVFNSGGHPTQGTIMVSASFQIRTDALGEAIVGPAMTAPSYQVDSGFGSAYLPPGEVQGLRFETADTLAWDSERSAGTYNVYRDMLTAAGEYGGCHEQSIPGASVVDTDVAPIGQGYFYLVTVENRIQEEGVKGRDSSGAIRGGGVCP